MNHKITHGNTVALSCSSEITQAIASLLGMTRQQVRDDAALGALLKQNSDFLNNFVVMAQQNFRQQLTMVLALQTGATEAYTSVQRQAPAAQFKKLNGVKGVPKTIVDPRYVEHSC